MERKRTFPGISPVAWEHPADGAALAAFSSIPLAADLLRKAVSATTERSLRLGTLANSARVSDSQFASLHAILKEAAERLDLSPLPELYVRLDPSPDARTLGVDRPFILLSSGALDLWDQEELSCVLAHEIGHILSGHAVYKTLLGILIKASSIIAGSMPLGGAAIMAALTALKEWDRKSELSADRAALLVVQEAPIVYRALMKSAAGARIAQMDVNEFFRQALDYEIGGGALDSLYKLVDVLGESHPFPITRMTALQEWEKGGAYAAILRGEYPRRGAEGERDAQRDFERARSAYAGEFAGSEDPLAKAAGKVLDAVGGLFGQTGGGQSKEGGSPNGRDNAAGPRSIEDVIDEIFGSKGRGSP
ncbi:MAG: M48 family metallopeptidase [Rectinemataceae bacterium]|jgi:Zn-dependent protease with chaperone function